MVRDNGDRSQMGLAHRVVFRTGEGLLMVVSTYWPPGATTMGSTSQLGDRVSQWLRNNNQRGTGLEYIQEVDREMGDRTLRRKGQSCSDMRRSELSNER